MSSRVHIDISKEKIAKFCRRNHIRKLSLFGSVLREDYRPDSDIDILVEFEPDAGHSLLDFVRLQDELTELLGRKVDLVDRAGLRNPFRRYEILHTQQVIFAA